MSGTETPPPGEAGTKALARRNRRVGMIAFGVVAGMVGMSYAAVPLYQMFCQVTGFGGTTQRADAAPTRVTSQTISVRFDANVAPGLGWGFTPEQTAQTLKIGEQKLAFYKAVNNSGEPVSGQAVFNVTPDIAGQYFNKIECFCFTEQKLEPGQAIDMPVVYFVDPAILDDPQARKISEITLSYTFYKMDKSADATQRTSQTSAAVKGATRS